MSTTSQSSIEVREVMTPGVVVIPADASVDRLRDALSVHRVHAVLVVERHGGRPVGWATARGLLRMSAEGRLPRTAGQAVVEPARTISPSATVADAVAALAGADTGALLVCHGADSMPEGVVTELDVVSSLR
jgi:CBS domain-containing protein